MDRKLKSLLALVLSVFMSVSTLNNMYTVRADDEITQEGPIVEEMNITDGQAHPIR